MTSMIHSFLQDSIPELVNQLTLDEKISLLGAPNWWNTNAVQRLKIPSVRMSDGPNGVRGSSHFISTPSQCIPCATSLAATFDPEIVNKIGVFLAEEAKTKSSVILLAPTCNVQRSPLGGRAFESFSEDPHLSGMMAAAYVNGLQSKGVSACIKHFVGNDQEHERTAANSVVSERALREIYLYPFMLAQKHAKPWAFMTSYGRIDNVHCSENPRVLEQILRSDWKFEGLVMSDWYGTYSTAESINAGLDLEMPGPPRWRTPLLVKHSLSAQKTSIDAVDTRVTELLKFVQKQAHRNPDVVFGDGKERSRDSPEGRALCRKIASEGIVLLKNNEELLPITPKKLKKIAVIGPNAKGTVISGGGSAALKPTYVVTPWDGLVGGAPEGIELEYSLGCYAHKFLPTLENNLKTPDGETGWRATFYNSNLDGQPVGGPVAEYTLNDTRIRLNDFLPSGLGETWALKIEGLLTFDQSGEYELGVAVAGRAKLYVEDKLVVDNWTKQTPGEFYYGQGTVEEKGDTHFESGKALKVLIEYTNTSPPAGEGALAQPALMRGFRLGGCLKIDPEQAIKDAAELAARSDAVIFVGGLTPEWESEGFDRPSLDLPGRQDETIAAIVKANPKTVVCIQAGSAVGMPWVNEVDAVIQAWYLGNEVGNALADVIYGVVNPSGRLPLTLPARMEDIAAYPNLASENGHIHYREDLFVGYKHFHSRGIRPLFPFGHGLSYTTFELTSLNIEKENEASFIATATVKNTGAVRGSEVVQIYVSYPNIGVTTPALQLRAFNKAIDVAPGSSAELKLHLDRLAFSFWDEVKGSWGVRAGTYGIYTGSNSNDLHKVTEVDIEKSFHWMDL